MRRKTFRFFTFLLIYKLWGSRTIFFEGSRAKEAKTLARRRRANAVMLTTAALDYWILSEQSFAMMFALPHLSWCPFNRSITLLPGYEVSSVWFTGHVWDFIYGWGRFGRSRWGGRAGKRFRSSLSVETSKSGFQAALQVLLVRSQKEIHSNDVAFLVQKMIIWCL